MNASAEMPRYDCHKTVHALKIKYVEANADGEWTIIPDDPRYTAFVIPAEYLAKHSPQPGGYYVVYEDGYKSYSPAAAFESGYTRIDG